MKKATMMLACICLAATAWSGQCQIQRNAMSGDGFEIINPLDSTVTLSFYERNDQVPFESSTVSAKGNYQGNNKNVVRICGYKTGTLRHNMTQTTKLACCQSSSGFMGDKLTIVDDESYITYHGTKITQQDLKNTPSAKAKLSGKVLGSLMGY